MIGFCLFRRKLKSEKLIKGKAWLGHPSPIYRLVVGTNGLYCDVGYQRNPTPATRAASSEPEATRAL